MYYSYQGLLQEDFVGREGKYEAVHYYTHRGDWVACFPWRSGQVSILFLVASD